MSINLQEKISSLEKENAELNRRIKSLESRETNTQTTLWLQTIIDSLPNPLFIKNADHSFVLVNNAFTDFVGFTKEELLGQKDSDFFLKEQVDIFMEMDTNVLETGRTNWNEEKITIQGKSFEILTSKALINDAKEIPHVLGLITDISGNKNQQILLLKKNEEIKQQKENIQILLKEVHHRVKNNLQIVISLLNLQMARLSDEVSIAAFLNSKNRILAMGRVHDLLSNSETNADINFHEYLSDLIENIRNSFKTTEKIKFDIRVPHFKFQIDIIIPLGLLINEIITNSVKHGVVKNDALKISIEIIALDNKFVLNISDNGTSIIKACTVFSKKKLGTELIELFCEQISALCEMNADSNGVSYRITFDLPE